jgi:hypothetical protein
VTQHAGQAIDEGGVEARPVPEREAEMADRDRPVGAPVSLVDSDWATAVRTVHLTGTAVVPVAERVGEQLPIVGGVSGRRILQRDRVPAQRAGRRAQLTLGRHEHPPTGADLQTVGPPVHELIIGLDHGEAGWLKVIGFGHPVIIHVCGSLNYTHLPSALAGESRMRFWRRSFTSRGCRFP